MVVEFQNEIKAPVLKIFWILKSLLTSAINLSDNGRFFKHSFFIYLVPQYLLILFYLNCIFSPINFTSRCMPSVPPNFLIRFANKTKFLILY